MTQGNIRAQIQAMPNGHKKELADYMNRIYEGEYNDGWEAVEQTYDLLKAPTWKPPADGEFMWSDATAITETAHDRLVVLRERAGGWFYLKDGELTFVNLEDWEKIKTGERTP